MSPLSHSHNNEKSDATTQGFSSPAYLLSSSDICTQLDTDAERGLSDSEASSRLKGYGPNVLKGDNGVSVFKILAKQLGNAMMIVLILGLVVSLAIRSWIEGAVVGLVIVLNVVVGSFQEYSAEKTMDSLRSMASPTARVIRDGRSHVIPSQEIVPGDMVELKLGDTVPADIYLLEAMNLETDEALLTGESFPVQKNNNSHLKFDSQEGDVPLGDRVNIVYSSSNVTKGRGRGIVVATGMQTEIGAIARSLSSSSSQKRTVSHEEDGKSTLLQYLKFGGLLILDKLGQFSGITVGTPLQRKLSRLAVYLFISAVVCAIIVLAANSFSNKQSVILYAVGTGLSMIPESLVVVLTITMAVGTKVMVQRNVIVRKLDSLEALGGVTNICSDKTGTLTQGRMVVRKSWVIGDGTYTVDNVGNTLDPTSGSMLYDPRDPDAAAASSSSSSLNDKREGIDADSISTFTSKPALKAYLNATSLANVAVVSCKTGTWEARGDPTEIAAQVYAHRFHFGSREGWEQLAEFPFDSEVKRMSVICANNEDGDICVFMKGAVERVLDSCRSVVGPGGDLKKLDEEMVEYVLRNMEVLASHGLRVLAFARRISGEKQTSDFTQLSRNDVEKDMTLLGLLGIYDPPRTETAGAVAACHSAGITVHMVTGDHPQTAQAIAKEIGILPRSAEHSISKSSASSLVMTASAFDKLSDTEVDQLPFLPLVLARCAPQTKVRMVNALHRRKKYVAMTGDGVNDSPALKRSNVGIGMGLTGSDVAKSASDIVLTDDNFASILNAIEEGRRMFDNIQKFILHLLAQNVAQALVLLISLVFKDSTGVSVFPLAPVEILWILMVTSSFPAMGLGMEVAAPDIMTRSPNDIKWGVFSREVIIDMFIYGIWMAILCLNAFSLVMFGFGNGDLGTDCNEIASTSCNLVFRARTTTFVCMTWFSLFLAWELVSLRRSFFRMQPGSNRPLTQWMFDIWRNKFLFCSVIVGFILVFPIIYIPVINKEVFKHAPISWEWAVVFVDGFLFFAGVEMWKWAKRVYFRHKTTAFDETEDPSLQLFLRYTTPVATLDTCHTV